MSNPLLTMHDLPPFSSIAPRHIEPAIDTLLNENRARIEQLLDENSHYTWDNLVQPLEEVEERLNRVWSPVRHMNSVVSAEELRAAYNACLPRISDYATELGQNRRLFLAYQAIAESPEFAALSDAQRKTVQDALRDFRLTGVDLPEDKKRRFKAIQQELSRLQSKFEEHLLDATNAWSKHIADKNLLAGMPESMLAMMRSGAKANDLEGWRLTLEFPCYHAVMSYADDRRLREEMYTAYMTRASDQGTDAGQFDNTEAMEKILALRREAAQLLGFAHYAEKSLATKMAESSAQVLSFLDDLAVRARPVAERELSELQGFAREHLGIEKLASWDLAYAGEKLRQHKFALSQQDLKPYFPVDQVLKGLFTLVGRLYELRVREIPEVDAWHPDVRLYEITDGQGSQRGRFYLDLYARPKKRGGAWMDECINRLRTRQGLQTPVAYMTCNASPPVEGMPALFTHDEVLTLFHEFGHGLHHMLTQVDTPSVAGINGVEWDAVELPSQFMENWCWEREALDLYARHYETGEPLPEKLFNKLIASRHFHAGLQMLRQVELALFDFRLHMEDRPLTGQQIQAILDTVRTRVAVVHPPEFSRFQHGFAHIFAGGYAAGYYSYKWAEVLSADVFAAFEEQGLFNPEIGKRFLHAVLERGGSRPAMELFKEFRRREPQIDALLRHNGLAA